MANLYDYGESFTDEFIQYQAALFAASISVENSCMVSPLLDQRLDMLCKCSS